jgi:hypothetical protein
VNVPAVQLSVADKTNSARCQIGGAVVDDRIVLHRQDTNGKESRWSREDIRSDSFVFRDEESRTGGKIWQLREESHMKRPRCAVVVYIRTANGATRREVAELRINHEYYRHTSIPTMCACDLAGACESVG